jgi:uncharacterized protein (TIGR02466 family)
MKNNEYKVHNLWPIPVYEDFLPVKQEWKDKILNLEYERTTINNSDISKDRFILNDIKDLKKEIEIHNERYVRHYLKVKENINFYMLNSWSNKHGPKEYSQVHYHGNSLVSGVYYPILPKDSGDIMFHKTDIYTNLFHHTIRFEFTEPNEVNSETYVVKLKEGSIVLFPSHLNHSVMKNLTNQSRYSIAFNFFIKGKLGKEEYQLELQ